MIRKRSCRRSFRSSMHSKAQVESARSSSDAPSPPSNWLSGVAKEDTSAYTLAHQILAGCVSREWRAGGAGKGGEREAWGDAGKGSFGTLPER